MNSQIPAQMGQQITVLRHWKDGPMLVGSSNLTGRTWNGSVWYFDDSDLAPDVRKCVTGHELEAGVCDARILPENKFIVSMDSGTIELMEIISDSTINNGSPVITSLAYSCEHDDMVQSIDVACGSRKIVSGGWDRVIKVWDLESFTASLTYRDAHGDLIWMLACHPNENDIFITCSQDKSIRLWDTRLPRPATEIGKGVINGITTAVSWDPQREYVIAYGNESGMVGSLDVRRQESTQTLQAHNRRVNELAFAPHTPHCVASCADESKIVVSQFINIPEIIYENDSHSDFVRGVSWNPSSRKLYSAGFDSLVKSHEILAAMNCHEENTS